MIISKENLNKIEVIARKMSYLGLGEVKELKQELAERYLKKELERMRF